MNINSNQVAFKRNIIINLNNISYTNSSKISQKIITVIDQISENYEDYYKIYVDILFKKATNHTENIFIDLYTDLCNKTFKHILNNSKEQFLLFYRTIINKCQEVFEAKITPNNKDEVTGCAVLVSNFINKKIINKELVNKIIHTLITDKDEEKINILIALISSFSSEIKLESSIVDEIHTISKLNFNCSRINILLEDIVDKYRK